jgi:FXSXX-COOH protein
VSTNQELDVVTQLPKISDLATDELLSLDRSVLANAIRRLWAMDEHPEEAVSAFGNSPSVQLR